MWRLIGASGRRWLHSGSVARVLQQTSEPSFIQSSFALKNPYREDPLLERYLRQTHADCCQRYEQMAPGAAHPLPPLDAVLDDLDRFGQRVVDEVFQLHLLCDQQLPRVEHFDAWGNRIDRLITGDAWKRMRDVSFQEGVVAIAYEQPSAFSRVWQMAKLFLYSANSGLYGCPMAMTDGAARITKGLSEKVFAEREAVLKRLTSRDPHTGWTSGQWMTEKKGGSDVSSGTETVAVRGEGGRYRLYGMKWFSSATDADMAYTLARIADADGRTADGGQGLGMFFLRVRDHSGALNGIQIRRLKQKLGTRQVPTAELLLNGTHAHLVSPPGRGVAAISDMLLITRIHNASSCVSNMRRMLQFARDYSTRRRAFGKLLKDHRLHVKTLAQMELQTRAAFVLYMEAARLLGVEEAGIATDAERHLLRLVTPICKLYTAKQALQVVSEGLECFGGQGYMEDSGLPVMLRDTQVTSIWEGTTNILSLDVLRAMQKSDGASVRALEAFVASAVESGSGASGMGEAAEGLAGAARRLRAAVSSSSGADQLDYFARQLAFELARLYSGALLVRLAVRSGAPLDAAAANAFVRATMPATQRGWHFQQRDDYELVFENFQPT